MGKYSLSVKVDAPKAPDAPKTPDAPKWDEALPASKQGAAPTARTLPVEVRINALKGLNSRITGNVASLPIPDKIQLKQDIKYAITGKPNPTDIELKKASRELFLKTHPDKGGNAQAFQSLKAGKDLLELDVPSGGLKGLPSPPPSPPRVAQGAAGRMPPPPPYRAPQSVTGGTAPVPTHIPTTRNFASLTGAAPTSGKNFFQKNPGAFAAGAAALTGTAAITGAVLAGTSGPSGAGRGIAEAGVLHGPVETGTLPHPDKLAEILGYDVPYEPEVPTTDFPVLGQVEYAY